MFSFSSLVSLALTYGPRILALAETYGPMVVNLVHAVTPIVQAVAPGIAKTVEEHLANIDTTLKSLGHDTMTPEQRVEAEQHWVDHASRADIG